MKFLIVLALVSVACAGRVSNKASAHFNNKVSNHVSNHFSNHVSNHVSNHASAHASAHAAAAANKMVKVNNAFAQVNVVNQLPAAVQHVTEEAAQLDPAISSAFSEIAEVCISSPMFKPVESEIERYAKSHLQTVNELEECDERPSHITDVSSVNRLKHKFPKLAKAASALVSEESTHSSLADIQESLQNVMQKFSTIVTAGSESFECHHASLAGARKGINKAQVAIPSIFTDVEILTTMESISPSLSDALAELTEAAEYESSALHKMKHVKGWSQSNEWRAEKTLRSIANEYPQLYEAVNDINKFTERHSSAAEAFQNVVDVLTSVTSIISDVNTFVSIVSSSFEDALNQVKPALQVNSHLTTEVTYLDLLEAKSPSLRCAEGALEHDARSHANTENEIHRAIVHPSTITSPSYIGSLEHRYGSLVDAWSVVDTVEESHPSFAYVQSQLTYYEITLPSLLTVVQSVISETSPSLIGDEYDMEKIYYVLPSISTVLDSLSYIFERSPSLSCDESVVAQYASEAPSVIYTIEEAINSPSVIASSSVAYVAHLTAEYHSLASAIRQIHDAKTRFPSLSSIQSKISFVLTYEPSIISVHKQITEYDSEISQEVCSFAPSSKK